MITLLLINIVFVVLLFLMSLLPTLPPMPEEVVTGAEVVKDWFFDFVGVIIAIFGIDFVAVVGGLAVFMIFFDPLYRFTLFMLRKFRIL